MNVSESVWGSFGYQGAAGVRSVVFHSWAHWPPEHSQSRHNELLMTLWVTGRERASAHTQHNGEPTQAPHVWCPCAYTPRHAHKKNTQSHIQMFSDKESSRSRVLGGDEPAGRLYLCDCYSNVLLYDFNFSKYLAGLKWYRFKIKLLFCVNACTEATKQMCTGCLRKDLRTSQLNNLPIDWSYLLSWFLPIACLPIAHWYVFLGDWLWWG